MKYNTKNYTVLVLREALSVPGWALTLGDMYIAGKLLGEILPVVSSQQSVIEQPAPEFELSDKQYDTVRKALKNAIEKGILLPSKYVSAVQEEFKLTGQE